MEPSSWKRDGAESAMAAAAAAAAAGWRYEVRNGKVKEGVSWPGRWSRWR